MIDLDATNTIARATSDYPMLTTIVSEMAGAAHRTVSPIPVTAVLVIVRVGVRIAIAPRRTIFAAVSIKASPKTTALETALAETAAVYREPAACQTATSHREPGGCEIAAAKAVTYAAEPAAKPTAMTSAAKPAAKPTTMTSAASTTASRECGCAGSRCRDAEHDGRSCCYHLFAHFSYSRCFR
jgi:hypothetical protein